MFYEVGPRAASELPLWQPHHELLHRERGLVGALAHPVGATNTANGCEGVVRASCPVIAPDRGPLMDCTAVCLHTMPGALHQGESQSFEGCDSYRQ